MKTRVCRHTQLGSNSNSSPRTFSNFPLAMQRCNLYAMNTGDRVYPDLKMYIRDLYYDTMCGNDHVWVKCRDAIATQTDVLLATGVEFLN